MKYTYNDNMHLHLIEYSITFFIQRYISAKVFQNRKAFIIWGSKTLQNLSHTFTLQEVLKRLLNFLP